MKKLIIAMLCLGGTRISRVWRHRDLFRQADCGSASTLPGVVSGHGVEREPLGHVFVHWVKLEE